MPNLFSEGVRPGGLTTATEIRILLCYLLDSIDTPISREQIDEVLLGEGLVNYFVMADSLAQLKEQGLISERKGRYTVTPAGRTVGRDLADDVPRSIREAAVRGVIRAQQYAAKAAVNNSEIQKNENGYQINCSIRDAKGLLFALQLYMPDAQSAQMVQNCFVENGDEVYKLLLAGLTRDEQLVAKAMATLQVPKKG